MGSADKKLNTIKENLLKEQQEIEDFLMKSDQGPIFKMWLELNSTINDLEESKYAYNIDPKYNHDLNKSLEEIVTPSLLYPLLREQMNHKDDSILIEFLENELKIDVENILAEDGILVKKLLLFRQNVKRKEAIFSQDPKRIEEIIIKTQSSKNYKESVKLWEDFRFDSKEMAINILNEEIIEILNLIEGKSIEHKLDTLDKLFHLISDFNRVLFNKMEHHISESNDDYLLIRKYINENLLSKN